MRKEIALCMVIGIFLIGLSSALSTDMKAKYAPGETMIVKVSGNIVDPLSVRQVSFLRAGNVQEVPTVYDLKKLGDTYYLWALAPKIANTYTLILRDVATTVAGTPTKIEFRQNFSVTGNLTDYIISPGLVITDGAFQVHVQLYADEERTIMTDFPQKRDIILKPGDTVVDFPFENVIGSQVKMITLGRYAFPVYFTGGSSPVNSNASFSFAPTYLTKTLSLKEKNKSVNFRLVNIGKEEIKNIRMVYSSDVFTLIPDEETTLKSGESKTYALTLLKSDGIRVQEQISARAGERTIVLPIRIDFTENITENVSSDNDSSGLYRCSELGGNICTNNQQCTGSVNASQEGNCCVGTCIEKKVDTGGESSTLGYVLAVLVILGLGYLYWKYKMTRVDANPLPKKIKEAEHLP